MSTGEFVELNKENEHILVCLSSSPSNEKIIRTAAKMARDMDEIINPDRLVSVPFNKTR